MANTVLTRRTPGVTVPATRTARRGPATADPHRLVPVAERARKARLGRRRSVPGARLLGPLAIVAVWQLSANAGLLDPRLLTGPDVAVKTGWALIESGRLQENVWASMHRALLGLALGTTAGVVLAVVGGLTRVGEAFVDGTLQVKRAIPNLALIPLLILWLGIGEEFKVMVIALGVLIPIYINTYGALVSIDNRYVELAETLRLSRRDYLRKVIVPGALPGFFLGFRLAVVGSWMALIVVETINATSGVGYMMAQAQLYAQSDIILVGLVVYGIFGFTSDSLVRGLERRALSWRRTLAS